DVRLGNPSTLTGGQTEGAEPIGTRPRRRFGAPQSMNEWPRPFTTSLRARYCQAPVLRPHWRGQCQRSSQMRVVVAVFLAAVLAAAALPASAMTFKFGTTSDGLRVVVASGDIVRGDAR